MASKRATASNRDLGQLRLANQRILGSSFTTPTQVVRWMLAMQAQDFAGAKWSVALRTAPSAGVTDADVETAIASRHIVRSWPMRGTLHFTAAEDLPWMLALTTRRLIAGAAKRRANLELDEATLERARALVMAKLAGGGVLTREELLAHLASKGVSTAGQRGYHILWHLAQTGTLCFGPPRAKAQTFVLLDEWIRQPRRLGRDEALGELALRYFISHGPATLKDFAAWTKLTAGDVKVGLAVARSQLSEIVVEGVSHFMAANAEQVLTALPAPAASSVVLLPGFDEYLLGYQDRAAVLAREHAELIVPGGNGMFMATIVVGGRVVGTWRRHTKVREIVIVPAPFARLSAASVKALTRAVEAYGRFLKIPTRAGTALPDGVQVRADA